MLTDSRGQPQPRETKFSLHEQRLLAMTNNAWEVHCFRDGNRRKLVRIMYVRASTRERAEETARSISGVRYASATAWDPRESPELGRWIRKTQDTPHAN